MNAPQLESLLNDLESAHVDSDGMARLVVTSLVKQQIPYRVMLGKLQQGDKIVSPHFWVEANDCVIDYRARQSLGAEARHGVIPQAEVENQYQGQEIVIDPLPDYLFEQYVR